MSQQQFDIFPPNEKTHITASVGFISPEEQPDTYVMIKNIRGWDIPGGHVEDAETPLETLDRELKEEACCQLLPGSILVAQLKSEESSKTGMAVYRGACKISSFSATAEISSRKMVTHDELLTYYFGDKSLLQRLLDQTVGVDKIPSS